MKKTFNYFLTILAFLIFLLSMYIIVFGTIAKKNNTLLNIFGYSSPVVLTDSMAGDKSDSFAGGSLLLTKKVDFSEINVGDIVVFKDNDDEKLIVHRVVKIEVDGSLVTKGDANNDIDPYPVTPETFQAKVINSFSFFGLGTKLPSYQLAILGFIIIALIIYIFVQVIQITIAIKKKKLAEFKENYHKQ